LTGQTVLIPREGGRLRRMSTRKIERLILTVGVISSIFVFVPQSNADTLCNNGTLSKSSGRGTCSWNGGIAGGSSSSKNNSFGYSDPWGSSSSSKKNSSYGYSDPWGSSSSSKKNSSYGYSDPWGSSSSSSRYCSYIDRSKGRC
jgi:hypothetical protein